MKRNYALRSFLRYSATYKGAFIITFVSFAVADALIAIFPWLVGGLTAALSDGHHHAAWWWVAALIGASVGHDIFWRLSEVLHLRLISARMNRYDDVVFRAVMQRDYAYFVNKFSGKIGSYATSLGREFRELTDNFFFNYIDLFIRLPTITVIMFTVNVWTGTIFVVSLGLMWLSGRKLLSISAKAERTVTDARSDLDGYTVDTIANFVSVKAFGNTRREGAHIARERETVIRAAIHSGWRAIWFWGAMSIFVRWIIWPSTIVLNVYLFMHHRMSLAHITTFLSVIVIFSQYIWQVVWNIMQLTMRISRTEEAYRYLFGEQVLNLDAIAAPESIPAVPFTRELALHDVTFAYPDKVDTAVLKHVSLRIQKGEKIGVVGVSGGGKTTLIKLLLGYYELPHDMLLVDGQPTDNRTLASLISYVPQDTALFHRTIRENIAYSKLDATEAEIIAAAKHAQAHDFIMQLPHGYDTLVGERGIKLSGGQRQRVAIARAILRNAPILVLDEATSALDSESELYIQQALQEVMKDRTAIVIAHRLSTIQKMDRIIVLDNGEIVEQGTHAELLKLNGAYAQLWAHQSGGFIEE